MTSTRRILLVDDDRHLANSMVDWLRDGGDDAVAATDIESARQILKQKPFDLAIIDLRLGRDDGMKLIASIGKDYPDLATLAITGYATPATAVEAVRAGAMDLLTKPVMDDELQVAIDRAVEQRHVAQENRRLKEQLDRRSGMESILSHDYRMRKIFDVVESVADARASILITGENGTGKSMIARAIHNRSSRRGGPLVEVACGALPDQLLESELFGHVAGAYTGAHVDRKGKFELADGGTLFLDEIATATPAMQVKLLRVLQELKFEPLGGSETRSTDARVIFATNEDLDKAVAEDRFRQDLFYRINVVNIRLPALRERAGDVPLLVDHFIREASETSSRQVEGFDRQAMQVMTNYSWPGNIRQLENVVERAVLLSQQSVMTVEDLPPELTGMATPHDFGKGQDFGHNQHLGKHIPAATEDAISGRGQTLKEALEGPERQIILQTLMANDWNRVATAQTLDINRTTLYKKMKRLGLDDPKLQYAF